MTVLTALFCVEFLSDGIYIFAEQLVPRRFFACFLFTIKAASERATFCPPSGRLGPNEVNQSGFPWRKAGSSGGFYIIFPMRAQPKKGDFQRILLLQKT